MGVENISKNYRTFSGIDTLVFIVLPGTSPIVLGSVTTVSYSMYRTKRPVINIGKININGVTRGPRIYAGSMVFTLVNQHWLEELKDYLPYLNDYGDIKVDELPIFDLMIVSANEYGAYVQMFIYGVDMTDEGQTVSVEDLFTENVFKFVARDVSNFTSGDMYSNYSSHDQKINKVKSQSSSVYILPNSNVTIHEIDEIEQLARLNANQIKEEFKNWKPENAIIERELIYSSSNTLIGNDVAEVQSLLKQFQYVLDVNGIYDQNTYNIVKQFQSDYGLDITGNVNATTYLKLKELLGITDPETELSNSLVGLVINKAGTHVYLLPDINSNIINYVPYNEQINIQEVVTVNGVEWYKTELGYILKQDIFLYGKFNDPIEFPTIKRDDESYYVTVLQKSLEKIYGTFSYTLGVFDLPTETYVKQFQREHSLIENGIVTNDVWTYIQGVAGNVVTELIQNNFAISFQNAPGKYSVSSTENVKTFISSFAFDIATTVPAVIKITVISQYKDSVETTSKIYYINQNTTLNIEDFLDLFIYNLKYKQIPDKTEIILYPNNKTPYKWTVTY